MSFEHAELHLSILGMKMSLFILFNFYYMILLILRVFFPSVIEHMFTTTSSLRRMLLSIPQCTCRCCFNFLEKIVTIYAQRINPGLIRLEVRLHQFSTDSHQILTY